MFADFYSGNSFVSKYSWARTFVFLVLHPNDLDLGSKTFMGLFYDRRKDA